MPLNISERSLNLWHDIIILRLLYIEPLYISKSIEVNKGRINGF